MRRVIEADCIDAMRELDEASVDAICTDPPYGIGFMGKEWDAPTIARAAAEDAATRKSLGPESASRPRRAQPRSSSAFGSAAHYAGPVRAGGEWQAWCFEWATEALRVLKPGGHLLAFGGTRTYHRLACAVEDAGFEIRDSLIWLYGSGFPKSHNGEWGGTALKPGHEPIVMARKPLAGTVAENFEQHGTGALNIDGCRIEGTPRTTHGDGNRQGTAPHPMDWGERNGYSDPGAAGRWPANVVLDEASAAELDRQSGELHSQDPTTRRSRSTAVGVTEMGTGESIEYADRGGASRFFYCAKASRGERNAGLDGFKEQPGPSEDYGTKKQHPMKAEGEPNIVLPVKNAHPTVKPIDLMRWLVRLVTPPGGTVLDPFAGSGTTGIACVIEDVDFIGIEREPEYAEMARARIEHAARQPKQLTLA